MSLQQIIDSAVNVEINRSKLVAQTISRSGRISTASRNWANPFRFTVTPKPVWTASEYRSVFAELLDRDRYEPMSMYLNNISQSTFLATGGNSWMIPYQGGADTTANNNNIDSYEATTDTANARIVLSNVNSATITAGIYIAKKGDYLRLSGTRYPYISTADVIIPTAVSGITGTVASPGSRVALDNTFSSTTFITTATRTVIYNMSTTTGLSVGQIISKTAGNAVLGGITYIENITSATQITIVSTTDINLTAGNSITISGTGNTSTPTVCVPIHRGYMGTVSTNTAVRVGARAAQFVVNVVKLPQIRYLPGQLIELTGDIELVEEIL